MILIRITIREILADKESLLPYAKEDIFALVCFFSQKQNTRYELVMRFFIKELMKHCQNLGGSFYLPYRLHYTKQMLKDSYPEIDNCLINKKIFYK
ncbi:MAG: hypothetical protein ISN64_04250 [Rickettsia sp.]|nr:hypothetical protein [Rickettsia sp.]